MLHSPKASSGSSPRFRLIRRMVYGWGEDVLESMSMAEHVES